MGEQQTLRLAIQKDGRMTDSTLALLEQAGLRVDLRSRLLVSRCRNFPLDVLAVRDDDVAEYVAEGVADLGIVGRDVLLERGVEVEIVEPLGFARCRLELLVPKDSGVSDPRALDGKRIATSYPRLLGRWLEELGISAKPIEVSGAAELAPSLGLAEACCDIVSSGYTARLHGLETIDVVLDSEAVLVSRGKELSPLAEQLVLRLRAALAAQGQRYVMMNAPRAAVETIKQILPALKSPTVMPLVDSDAVAIHSLVPESLFWEVFEKLRAVGASDFVVLPVERVLR